MPCFTSVTSYIESRLFSPPLPLFSFPSCFDSDRDLLPQLCTDLYFEDGIASMFAAPPHGVPPKYTVLYFHGNNENLPKLVPHVRRLAANLSAYVYAMEYPGYASCLGSPGEDSCYAAAEKFAAKVAAQSRAPVVSMGFSMGCAPALRAACSCRADAVVLFAPFVSAASVALAATEQRLAWNAMWAPVDVFCTLPGARTLACPLLVLHGTKDEVVPFCHGPCVAAAAKHGEFHTMPDASHAIVGADDAVDRARVFLEAKVPMNNSVAAAVELQRRLDELKTR